MKYFRFSLKASGAWEGPTRRGVCPGAPRRTTLDCPPERYERLLQCSSIGRWRVYENPWTVPNALCVTRIALSPVIACLVADEEFGLALGLLSLAGVTDLLDGFIARTWPSQQSALGSALDPLADKILISVLYISLTCAHLIPVPLTALIISRDIALIGAVFYVRYRTVPPPCTLARYFNPRFATAQLKPTLISKVNTAVQLFLVAASLAAPVLHQMDSPLLVALWYVTALTTVGSGYSYYRYGRQTVRVLNGTKRVDGRWARLRAELQRMEGMRLVARDNHGDGAMRWARGQERDGSLCPREGDRSECTRCRQIEEAKQALSLAGLRTGIACAFGAPSVARASEHSGSEILRPVTADIKSGVLSQLIKTYVWDDTYTHKTNIHK
ncbi:unnamed protein product [Lampetra planeri]